MVIVPTRAALSLTLGISTVRPLEFTGLARLDSKSQCPLCWGYWHVLLHLLFPIKNL